MQLLPCLDMDPENRGWLRRESRVEEPRTAARHADLPIHAAANAQQPKISVAVRYAFAKGRAALRGDLKNAAGAAKAVRVALLDVLPPTLSKALAAGGAVGVQQLGQRLRVAGEWDESLHPRDEKGQWTESGGDESKPVAISASLAAHPGMEMVPVKVLAKFMSEDRRANPKSSMNITEPTQTLLPRLTKELQEGVAIQEPLVLGYDTAGLALLVDGNTRLAAITDAGFTHAPVVISRQDLHGWGHKAPVLSNTEAGISPFRNWLLPSEIGLPTIKKRALAFRTAAPKPKPPFTMRFDARNPRAVAWARDHAGELAKDISDVTEERIKSAVASALEGGTLDEARDEILDAVGDETRAEMIARTESMRATNQGLLQSWDQAVEDGWLTGDEHKEWISAGDDGVCPDCEELDGEQVPINEDFSSGDDAPPAHPACRCTLGLTE